MTDSQPAASRGREAETFGRYQVLRPIGQGAAGTVFACYDPLLDRLVAVKHLRLDTTTNPERMLARFQDEVRALSRLNHPHIVQAFDAGIEAGYPYLAMELCQGPSLAALMTMVNRLSYGEVLTLVQQVASALDAIHARGLIHRDLKPSNLLVHEGVLIKLSDFGTVQVDGGHLTKTGDAIGTPQFMAPEQILGQDVDHRVDLFALGVVAFACLAGSNPFTGNSVQVMYRIVQTDAPRLRSLLPFAPVALDEFFARALARTPASRFGSASELAEAFEEAVRPVMAEPLSVPGELMVRSRVERPTPQPASRPGFEAHLAPPEVPGPRATAPPRRTGEPRPASDAAGNASPGQLRSSSPPLPTMRPPDPNTLQDSLHEPAAGVIVGVVSSPNVRLSAATPSPVSPQSGPASPPVAQPLLAVQPAPQPPPVLQPVLQPVVQLPPLTPLPEPISLSEEETVIAPPPPHRPAAPVPPLASAPAPWSGPGPTLSHSYGPPSSPAQPGYAPVGPGPVAPVGMPPSLSLEMPLTPSYSQPTERTMPPAGTRPTTQQAVWFGVGLMTVLLVGLGLWSRLSAPAPEPEPVLVRGETVVATIPPGLDVQEGDRVGAADPAGQTAPARGASGDGEGTGLAQASAGRVVNERPGHAPRGGSSSSPGSDTGSGDGGNPGSAGGDDHTDSGDPGTDTGSPANRAPSSQKTSGGDSSRNSGDAGGDRKRTATVPDAPATPVRGPAGRLRIKSVPGARIHIDGYNYGTTGEGKTLRLAEGTHTLELIPFNAGAPVSRKVTLRDGELKSLEYDFMDRGWRRGE